MKRIPSSEDLNRIKEARENNLLICGIDEVGRGPLAGPVLACAIIMPKERIEGIKDSKKLSIKKRIILDKAIRDKAIALGIGQASNIEIDKLNIKNATHLAMKRACQNLIVNSNNRIIPDLLVIDNEKIDMDIEQLSIVHGDDLIYEISCASIVAKVYRDNEMIKYSKIYDSYKFEKNKGYGTKEHYEGLDKYGISPIHRKSFLVKYFNKK